MNWSRRRECLILYWCHFNLQITITLFLSLSLIFRLNYKLENRDTTSLYYLIKNINPKNNNFFYFNGNPYYTPTSFDSDITNPTCHNFNQPSILDWSYPNNICPNLNTLNKTGTIITTLHRVSGDTTPPSHIVNHLTNIQLIYSFSRITIRRLRKEDGSLITAWTMN